MALTKITGELIETSPTLSTSITLTSTDAGSSAGPDLILYRNSSSPADADYLGQIQFKGRHDGSGDEIYAKVTGKISDASSGTEDGLIETAVKGNGSFVIVSRQKSDTLQLLNGVGLEVAGDATISGAFTSQGIDDNANATSITIDSSEKVGLNGLSAGDYWSSSNQLVLGNTASGANGGLTIATADNAVGQIYFADGTSGDAQYRGQIQYTHVSDAMDFQTAAGFRMRIDSSGNVGIGTASPSNKLDVNGAIRLMGTGTDNDSHILYFNNGACTIARDNNDLELHAYDNMIFGVSNTSYPSSTERMRIDSSGNVGIGSTPSTTIRNDHNTTEKALQVGRAAMLFSDTGLTTDLNNNTHLNNSDQRVSMTGTLGGSFYAQYNGEHTFYTAPAVAAPNVQSHSARFKIAQNGDLTATDTTIGSISDERLKKDIADYTGGLELVKNLRPRTFKFKDTTGVRKTNTQRGFIAQEVLAQDSYWISEEDASDIKDVEYDFTKDTEKRYLSKLHSKDAMYVSAIKELIAKVEELESKINE